MNVEKIEIITINVKDLEAAMKKFSDILGTTFHNFGELPIQKTTTEHSDEAYEQIRLKVAIDRRGFMELIESIPPVEQEGMRGIHYKVPNLDEAKEEMRLKGYRMVADVKVGNLKEAIFDPDDVCGIRLYLTEYNEPTMVEAMLTE